MAQSADAALWFLPFTLPICIYIAYTDLALMKITNKAVLALGAVFLLLGPFVMPTIETYLWALTHFLALLAVGMVLNALGIMGAGDAKFIAFSAPYVHTQDLALIMILFASTMLAGFVTHRAIRASRVRSLAPHWLSWHQGKRFPLGLALGPTLALYLCLVALNGA